MNRMISAFSFLVVAFFALPAFAADAAAASSYLGYIAIGASLAIGLAAAGGGIGRVVQPPPHSKASPVTQAPLVS